MSNPNSLPPGFRFHPTDEELVLHYLQNRASSLPCPVSIIAEVDIYKFDPWDLPDKAILNGDREWYFFSPRDRKYPNGVRPNRAAGSGYWKATGTDKPIQSSKDNKNIGIKKALVFYKGRPPKGLKTNWIMHEYRLAENENHNTYKPMKFRNNSMRLDDWVLCRIYKKNNHAQAHVPPLIEGEQEDSGIEEFESNNFLNFENIRNNNNIVPKLPKSSSISELFLEDYSSIANLFDNMQEMPQHNNFIVHQPSLSQILASNNVMSSNASATTSIVDANTSKRQRLNDINNGLDYGDQNIGMLHPSKKFNHTNGVHHRLNFNQFDHLSQGNSLINQSYFNQQILLNSQLGLQ